MEVDKEPRFLRMLMWRDAMVTMVVHGRGRLVNANRVAGNDALLVGTRMMVLVLVQ